MSSGLWQVFLFIHANLHERTFPKASGNLAKSFTSELLYEPKGCDSWEEQRKAISGVAAVAYGGTAIFSCCLFVTSPLRLVPFQRAQRRLVVGS